MYHRMAVPWLAMTAIAVHAVWGVLLLFTPDPLGCTPMAETPFKDNQYIAATVYLLAAFLAALPFFSERFNGRVSGILCSSLQQFLMMMSACVAGYCVWRGSYADEVVRPWAFILADQCWTILGMIAHTFAIIDWYVWSRTPNKEVTEIKG